MPRTLSASDMVTPGSLGLPPTKTADDEQAGQALLDGAPSSASLDTLIQHLVPTADYYPEKAYIFTFLLSSRLFIEPRELLARVCHLCIEQQQLDKPVLDKARVRKFGPKLLQLLAEWTETFPRDFQEEAAIGHMKDVVGRIAPCDEAYRKKMHQLLQALHQKLAALGQRPEGLVGADKPISYRTKPPASIHRELLGVCSDPYMLAQQLTHVELVSRPGHPHFNPRAKTVGERLRHIGPEEFVQAFVNKDPLASTQTSGKLLNSRPCDISSNGQRGQVPGEQVPGPHRTLVQVGGSRQALIRMRTGRGCTSGLRVAAQLAGGGAAPASSRRCGRLVNWTLCFIDTLLGTSSSSRPAPPRPAPPREVPTSRQGRHQGMESGVPKTRQHAA
ncbi:PREDICTED: ras-GEF domain-containing family member 1C [Chrysochloris asiatica]|uniref:Ras-GEF domain-containing family member 1C n=1 Tax=Chrysochloris asiatica TaxID=185453 RepID=A0A9B0U6P5_CHRAS|nr:PREDICTED: ras-GEF domain-containing family member 1C [Chrysochloris asiatica]